MKRFETPLFTSDTVEDVKLEIAKGINAPVVRVHHSTLGGSENISILILFSLDTSDTWVNDILENSRYSRHHLEANTHELEQFTWNISGKKLVKTRPKTIKAVIKRINDYIERVK